MLGSFRKGTNTIFAKILMALLVCSFGLWGIGDIFRGGGATAVATVDGESITQAELDSVIRNLQQQYPELTAEVAQSLPVRLQTVNRIINTRLLTKEAEALGLDFSLDALSGVIAKDPMFLGEDGNFNPLQLEFSLRQNGMSEGLFLQRYAQDIAISLIEGGVVDAVSAPDDMVALYYRIRNEQREATIILLGQEDVAAPGEPDDDALERLYRDHIADFTLPEYRGFRAVQFDMQHVKQLGGVSVSDEEIAAYYENNLPVYEKPAAREVEQRLFNSQDEAIAALEQGDAFASDEVIKLGAIDQSTLPADDSAVIFALEKDEISQPVQTEFGWHLYRVSAINDAYTQPLADVSESIHRMLEGERLNERLTTISNQLDDAVAGGATLQEALAGVGMSELSIVSFDPLSALNETQQGTIRELAQHEQAMLELAFSLDEGEISSVTLGDDSTHYLVETTNVIPARAQPLETVKDRVISLYNTEETQRIVREKAQKVADELAASDSPVKTAKNMGLSQHASGKLKRIHDTVTNDSQLKDKILTSGFVLELFRLNIGEVTGAYPLPSGEFAIGILDNIHPVQQVDSTEKEALKKELTTQLKQEALQSYLSALREKYSVELMMDKIATQSEPSPAS